MHFRGGGIVIGTGIVYSPFGWWNIAEGVPPIVHAKTVPRTTPLGGHTSMEEVRQKTSKHNKNDKIMTIDGGRKNTFWFEEFLNFEEFFG